MNISDKKNTCELINSVTELIETHNKIKTIYPNLSELDGMDPQLMDGGIEKINSGITDMKLCINNILSTQAKTVNQNKIFTNLTDNMVVSVPVRPTNKKKVSINITNLIEKDHIKRRHTDNMIRYKK